jgi:hypothetical protein
LPPDGCARPAAAYPDYLYWDSQRRRQSRAASFRSAGISGMAQPIACQSQRIAIHVYPPAAAYCWPVAR